MELGKISPQDQSKRLMCYLQQHTLIKQLENGSKSALKWSTRNGYPRAVLVFDNDAKNETTAEYFENSVSYPLDHVRLRAILNMYIEILKRGEPDTVEVTVNYPKNVNGVVSNNFIGKLIFGLNEQDGPYIIATRDTSKGVKFKFSSNTAYISFSKKDMVINADRECAIAYCETLIKMLELTYDQAITAMYIENKPVAQPVSKSYGSGQTYATYTPKPSAQQETVRVEEVQQATENNGNTGVEGIKVTEVMDIV